MNNDGYLLLEGGPPNKRLHWGMLLLCVAVFYFTDYQSFQQPFLLSFDQKISFKVSRRRSGEGKGKE